MRIKNEKQLLLAYRSARHRLGLPPEPGKPEALTIRNIGRDLDPLLRCLRGYHDATHPGDRVFQRLYRLGSPVWSAVFCSSALAPGQGPLSVTQRESFSRFSETIKDMWTFEMIAMACLLRWISGEGRAKEAKLARLIEKPSLLRWFFAAGCIEIAQQALDVESLRRAVLEAPGNDSGAIKVSAEDYLGRVAKIPFYSYLNLAREIIFWLGLHLNRKGYDPAPANGAYLILNRQLRHARGVDAISGEHDGWYPHLRNLIAKTVLGKTAGGIRRKFFHSLLDRFERVGLEGADINQEVDRAVLEAVEAFDPKRTSRPIGYFNQMIEKRAYTELRKTETSWRRITLVDATAAATDALNGETVDEMIRAYRKAVLRVTPKDDVRLSPDIEKTLRRWLSGPEAEVLAAKLDGEDDGAIAKQLGVSESRVRGLSAGAKRKVRARHPTPELIVLAFDL